MTVPIFLELVEAKAKVASIFPFCLGVYFSWYYTHQLNWGLSLMFFVAMLLFNMAVDAHDNYSDYKHATAKADEWKQKTNIIGVNHLSMTGIRNQIVSFVGVATVIGIAMTVMTGWPLLLMGVFCFAVGYFYAAGPRPISTTPFGEFFSGITMGFVIMLITVYLNTASSGLFTFELFWQVLLASGIAVFAISNIMLANNLCDADEDQLLNRKTLVYYLGKKGGLRLFVINYVLGYGCLILSVGLHYLPYTSLLVLLSLPLVIKNTRQFLAKQVKKETFKFAVKNAMILAVFCIVCIGVGTIANW
ncbi:1,4-dihydroxy-2-naphthoate polyprenyltransferase [Secundilactobacillus collinoides]|uniref:1,4-dihydroxy-2-naphthoate octaprenyltransferase n=1 Tax=Secundilactobacillus collinoides DSM 20515 = JCM 1123 TaxID=1423733 RepID=A0A0R2BDH7_SECCO|nr:1,4-dihydroxy-2-naphthoate polyprenyltransferase [Secundilactobacillus collinoides]KRM74587.1 1,4-dihydroxy-2-naphthoate octaprenyltransferase [Secundilactobacillus collinoides DSM 20515 = JCM 1123]